MKVGIASRKDRHTLEWACEWHIQGQEAGHLTKKDPLSCGG